MLRPLNLAFFLTWSACALAYLRYGGLLHRPLRERTARSIVYVSTLWLLIASVFNLFITASAFERYATGTLSTLTCALSLYLVWRRDGFRLRPCQGGFRR